ncbi:MAG: nucleotidyl transferase [Dehalococcoidia bacterium]|nr:nucleotidyl transferase [Dehalococcoidia bacterium]
MLPPKALILCAGEGTRLRPLTADRPKPMVPVGGKPGLAWIIGWLSHFGVYEIAINLHHRPEAVTDYFADGAQYGVRLTYLLEEQLLGSAGTARALASFLDRRFVLVYGDVLTTLDLSRLVALHKRSHALATLALYTVPNPSECGIVSLDAQGRVTRFVEKPPPTAVFSTLANSGIYVMEPDIIASIPPDLVPCDFGHDVFPALLRADRALWGLPIATDEYLIDFGTPPMYARAQREWPAAYNHAYSASGY